MSLKNRVIEAFGQRFGERPSFIVRSPGRVNLIGEHTDYNDGFVLPMAIDRAVWVALRPRHDGVVLVYSLERSDPAEFELSELEYEGNGWVEYVKGMSKMLQDAGHDLTGWEGVLTSDVPIGSGLSSSAALEMAGIPVSLTGASISPLRLAATSTALWPLTARPRARAVACVLSSRNAASRLCRAP